jgi:hypothetical protein
MGRVEMTGTLLPANALVQARAERARQKNVERHFMTIPFFFE